MDSTWESRDLVVLKAAVRHFDDVDALRLDIPVIVDHTGLAQDDVLRALKALSEASPPLVEGIKAAGLSYPLALMGVTERARRLVGAWPSPDGLADRLIAALEHAAEAEPDQDKKSKIRRTAAWLAGAGRDVLVQVAATAVSRSAGLG